MWQVGRSSTSSREYRDADYENGMNIILHTIPAVLPAKGSSRSALRLSLGCSTCMSAQLESPPLSEQAFFNPVFKWDSSSLQSTFLQQLCPPVSRVILDGY